MQFSYFLWKSVVIEILWYMQGRIQDFKLVGAHLKKIAPSEGRR